MVYLTHMPAGIPPGSRRAWEHKAGRALLRLGLERLGLDVTDDMDGMMEIGQKGKPFLKTKEAYFSISHSKGLAACAVEPHPVGLDIERVRALSPVAAQRILGPGEKPLITAAENPESSLIQLWTCKESWMKLTGLGLSQGLRETVFQSLGPNPQASQGGPFFHSLAYNDFWITEACEFPFTLTIFTVRNLDIM